MLNRQILEELRHVRNRQIPWHRKKEIFAKLNALGMVESGREHVGRTSGRGGAVIAVLSKRGRAEFERLRRHESSAEWEHYQDAAYAPGDVRTMPKPPV